MTGPQDAESAATRFRTLRSSLGLSQEQLARELGVSFATVNRWESGRTQLSARAQAALVQLEAQVAGRDTASAARGSADLAGAAAASTAAALPLARSSFVGRERELAELTRLIPESRIVTLIGPGGAGKSRLAAEVIRRSFPEAAVFLALEQLRRPRTLVSALASRLQVHDQQGAVLTDSIKHALGTTPRLLLLDGAEQIADQVADLAGDLLATVPELRIVVTSRVVLGLPGETCWTVPPLACPSVAAGAADIAASDAVQLFVARASERLPDFRASDVAPHAIAELCRRLDGLPLAIELIAGWVGTLSIREILQQRAVLLNSETVSAGQRGGGRRLTDVLQASYDLLSPGQQRRLAMLSVLAGPFRIDDVQAVLGVDAATAVTTTRLLVDSSWLVVTRTSEQNLFSMLETIRTFAAVRLQTTGDIPAARRRHALHWAEIAAGSEDGLGGPDAPGWTSRLGVAVSDLYEALNWAEEHADIDLGLAMSASLWRWWLVSGRLAVGRGWLARFLALAGPRTDELAGRALCSAAVLAAENGDYAGAIEAAEQSMAIFGPLGLKQRMALAATVFGSAHRYLGNTDSARIGFQTAMDLRAELGDRRGVAVSLNNLALFESDGGNLERARELFEQALEIKREIGEERSIALGLANLADVLIKAGRWDEAERGVREGAALAGGNPQLIGILGCHQGALAAHRRDWPEAEEHYRAAIAVFQTGGHPHDIIDAMIGLGRVCHQTGQRGEALRQLRGAQALATQTGNVHRLAEAQGALAEVEGRSGSATEDPAPRGAAARPARDAATAPVGSHLPGSLTSRQAEVLGLLAAGHSNKQIAAALFLSPATVERHLATIYRNLSLAGRVDAARFALENGLAAPASPPASQPVSGRATPL